MSIDEAKEEFNFFNEGDYITREMSIAKDIVLQELENIKSDLYESNHRITDLLLILGDRDRMIDLMAQSIDNYDSQLEINSYRDKDEIIEAFKEVMARRDFREKKRKEFEERCKNAKD